MELRILRPDGSLRYIRVRGEFIVDDQGRRVRRVGSVLDVTDQRTTENTLRESEERYRQIFYANQAMKHVFEPFTGKFVDANDAFCEFHGYEDVELSHGVLFYFAPPHHSWERGSNENANGLIRQYLPKGTCMEHLTQGDCDRIAEKLNARPRKRYNYRTPGELFT